MTINGDYGKQPFLTAYSKIGVGDYSVTNNGAKNTSITLYEHGVISYYGFSSSNFSHLFVGVSYMPSLYIYQVL